MKYIIILGILIFSENLVAVEARIIGGNKSMNNAYPFVVSLEYNGNEEQFCSGTLISSTKVLTAGHCVIENQVVQVRLGTNNKSKSIGQVIQVSNQVKHPKFNDFTLDYDVAVLTLISPAKLNDNVNVMNIPQSCSSLSCITGLAKPNTLVRVVGWGITSSDENSISADLKQVDVPIVSNTLCKKIMLDITNRMICAGFLKGGKDACFGDSGSPLFTYIPSAKAGLQAGITSWGDEKCGQPNSYGVYTRISDPEINSFIREEMNKLYY